VLEEKWKELHDESASYLYRESKHLDLQMGPHDQQLERWAHIGHVSEVERRGTPV
jgi:hypothetical protein